MDLTELGKAVRQARNSKKLTQAQLGETLGLSRQVILRLEQGQSTDIGLAKVLAILQAVGLDLSVRAAGGVRPTLEDMYAENIAERKARDAQARSAAFRRTNLNRQKDSDVDNM